MNLSPFFHFSRGMEGKESGERGYEREEIEGGGKVMVEEEVSKRGQKKAYLFNEGKKGVYAKMWWYFGG